MKKAINKDIKICANSITIKDENGKTCGVIRNIIPFTKMQANKQFEFSSKIRKAGLFGKVILKNICVKDNELFYFVSSRSEKYLTPEKLEEKKEIINKFNTIGSSIVVSNIL